MNNSEIQKAPEPKSINEFKEYNLLRIIYLKDNISQSPRKDDTNEKKDDANANHFNFIMTFFENEISFVTKENKDN